MGSELKATIPVLKGENNYEAWASIIRFHLRYDDLENYIDEDVEAPADTDVEAKKKWNRDRIRVSIMIQESLNDPKVSTKLQAAGWEYHTGDPYKTWTIVRKVIKHESEEAISSYLEEYTHLNHKTFDTMEAFVAKVHYLRNKLDSAHTQWGGKLPEGFHTTHIVNCLKAGYPMNHMFWEKALAKKELPWTKLMEDLNGISKRETEGARFTSIEVKGAKGNKGNNPSGNNPSGNTTNNRNKIKCDKCQRSYPKSWAYQSCGHHYPLGGICWTCNPE
ncbi:hypothetical protein B0T25DRAFT_170602 [Lasiosphaeria hispida]|uniref:DUF4219 domain-containing protein n=1 Tax=Lasiosphaeria hispida TaxID=260671 RepID=A0AAJ0MGI2_9PEZI|nr:hypothetical protein B0T25DRAFT_170602 [Lasiosphaeria hispida]